MSADAIFILVIALGVGGMAGLAQYLATNHERWLLFTVVGNFTIFIFVMFFGLVLIGLPLVVLGA